MILVVSPTIVCGMRGLVLVRQRDALNTGIRILTRG
jgi:hypothetical protein